MFEKMREKVNKDRRSSKLLRFLAITLLAVILLAVPIAAWLTYRRDLGVIQFIDTPGDLYITAGHGESLEYLNLRDINVTDAEKDCTYIVFGVRGSDASGYNLQFAYTTNNQFEYFLYPATQTDSTDANTLVEYVSHEEVDGDFPTYYYKIDTSVINNTNSSGYLTNASNKTGLIWNGSVIRNQNAPAEVSLNFLNLDSSAVDGNSKSVIMADDSQHTDTYGPYSSVNVQDFVEPIYMQVDYLKSGMGLDKKILDYYILEISWKKLKDSGAALTNDRESDIIYISVEATTIN